MYPLIDFLANSIMFTSLALSSITALNKLKGTFNSLAIANEIEVFPIPGGP